MAADNPDGTIGGGQGSRRKLLRRKGFAIGDDGTAREDGGDTGGGDIFAGFSGGAVLLLSRHAGRVASNFLSHDADGETKSREERLEKGRAR